MVCSRKEAWFKDGVTMLIRGDVTGMPGVVGGAIIIKLWRVLV